MAKEVKESKKTEETRRLVKQLKKGLTQMHIKLNILERIIN